MSNDVDHYKGWSIYVSVMPHRGDPSKMEAIIDFVGEIFVAKHAGESSENYRLTMDRTFSTVGECIDAGRVYARGCIDFYEP